MPSISNIKGDQIVTSSLGVGHQPNFVFDNDGHNVADISGSLILRGSGSVPTGPNGAGVIYYDPNEQKLKAVENGGAATDLLGGISNTDAQNDGVGQGLYKGNLDSNTLRFRSVIAGADIGILSGSDEITISYTGSGGGADGVNVGGGQGVYSGNTDTDTLSFRSLTVGQGINLISGSQTIEISETNWSQTGSVLQPFTADTVSIPILTSSISFKSAGPAIFLSTSSFKDNVHITGTIGIETNGNSNLRLNNDGGGRLEINNIVRSTQGFWIGGVNTSLDNSRNYDLWQLPQILA